MFYINWLVSFYNTPAMYIIGAIIIVVCWLVLLFLTFYFEEKDNTDDAGAAFSVGVFGAPVLMWSYPALPLLFSVIAVIAALCTSVILPAKKLGRKGKAKEIAKKQDEARAVEERKKAVIWSVYITGKDFEGKDWSLDNIIINQYRDRFGQSKYSAISATQAYNRKTLNDIAEELGLDARWGENYDVLL